MTALEQINDQVQHLLLNYKARDLVIRVGHSAEIAICTQVQDRQLPAQIGGVQVQRTASFKGWEVYANGREVE